MACVNISTMITSFQCKETEKIFNGKFSSKLPQAIQRLAARKLDYLDGAGELESRNRGLPLRSFFMSKRDFPPIHPGEILREEFLIPLGISQYRLAKEIHVPARRINE